jgi:hypothetical protein
LITFTNKSKTPTTVTFVKVKGPLWAKPEGEVFARLVKGQVKTVKPGETAKVEP